MKRHRITERQHWLRYRWHSLRQELLDKRVDYDAFVADPFACWDTGKVMLSYPKKHWPYPQGTSRHTEFDDWNQD